MFTRLDSEYQLKSHRLSIERVRSLNAIQLKDDNPEIIHPNEIVRDYIEEGGTWFLRTQNVRPLHIDTRNKVFISDKDSFRLSRNKLQRGDILLTRTGANRGQCAYFDRSEKAIASSHTFIIRPRDIDPKLLTLFFNTKYGTAQIDRGVYGAAQPEIAPYYLGNIWIPNISETLGKALKDCLSRSSSAEELAEQTIKEAEQSLLDALGLSDWTPPEPLTYTAKASEVFAAKRFDSRFFSPRIQALQQRLLLDKRTISDVASSRREKFTSNNYSAFNYIEIGDIDTKGSAKSTRIRSDEAPSRATWIVRQGDIITSTVRPIRRLSAQIESDQDGFVCSSGFAVITPHRMSSEVLLTYLRLPVICEILDLYSSASMYPSITELDILKLPIPIISETISAEIERNVTNSKASQTRSKQLLESAKRAVEIAIEEGEAAALAFLENAKSET